MKSKVFVLLTVVAVLFGLLLTAGSPLAQENSADGAKAAAQPRVRAQARGRLPNFYRQLVSPDQREKIYSIQKSYSSQIEDLEKQLADLVAKRNAEIESVLTPEQRAKLKNLEADAAKQREEARKRRAAERAAAEASSK